MMRVEQSERSGLIQAPLTGLAPRAVVIESNAYFRQAMSSRLRLLGIEPVIYETLAESWPLLASLKQGLAVLPLAEHGLDLLRYLRAQGNSLPCLLLSESPDPFLQEALQAHGARLCQPHPGKLAELIRRLDVQHYKLRFRFDGMHLCDLIQLLAKAGASTMVYFMQEQATPAYLCFEQGSVQHAAFGQASGEEAFFAIMAQRKGRFLSAGFGELQTSSIDSGLPRLLARSALYWPAPDEPIDGFAGTLSDLNLYDCLEILGMGNKDYRLSCSDAFSGERGEIRLGNGRIWHASFGQRIGPSALAACLRLKIGEVSICEAPRPLMPNLGQSVAQLLMSLSLDQDQSASQLVHEGLSLMTA